MPSSKTPAISHDWLNQRGGAEDVLESLVRVLPGAPIYTSIFSPEAMPHTYQEWDIRTSFLNRAPGIHGHHQRYLPFYPSAFGSLDLSGHDLVVSNKSGFAHGVRMDPTATHVCYCLTPTRFLWRFDQYVEQEEISPAVRVALQPFISLMKRWDFAAAQRVDHFISISNIIRQRVQTYYHRDSVVIFPPVDTSRFEPASQVKDYFLFVGRLVPYRRVDLLVEAFNRLGLPLVIAGTGRDRERLEEMAAPNIIFAGYVADADLPNLMSQARAFVWPGEEDFGIAPVQAMAAGRPVIAYAAGGALDTVVPSAGRLFAEQSVTAIIEAVDEFEPEAFSTGEIVAHARSFDTAVFERKMTDFIEQCMETDRLSTG